MTVALIVFAIWLVVVVPVIALYTSRSNHRAGLDPVDSLTEGRKQ